MKEEKDIYDDEIRIIGKEQPKTDPKEDRQTGMRRWWWLLALPIVLAALLLWIFFGTNTEVKQTEEPVMEEVETVFDPVDVSETLPPPSWLGQYPDITIKGYTQRIDTTLGQTVLSVYVPYNAQPELSIGALDKEDESIILAVQAADIRRDNKQILGSFVYKGKKISEGISKTGFCAIIDGEITLGVQENSTLYDVAMEKGGYFFRQYPLVDNGVAVLNNPKNITKRKALCDRQGQIFVVESQTNESFESFANALVALGVNHAIYLVGSYTAYGWWVDNNYERHYFCEENARRTYKNENYIVWKR